MWLYWLPGYAAALMDVQRMQLANLAREWQRMDDECFS